MGLGLLQCQTLTGVQICASPQPKVSILALNPRPSILNPRPCPPAWQEAAEEPRAAGELAALREQVAELASLAFATAKVEGVGLSSVAGEATSAAANTQHLAATLRTLLQAHPPRLRRGLLSCVDTGALAGCWRPLLGPAKVFVDLSGTRGHCRMLLATD